MSILSFVASVFSFIGSTVSYLIFRNDKIKAPTGSYGSSSYQDSTKSYSKVRNRFGRQKWPKKDRIKLFKTIHCLPSYSPSLIFIHNIKKFAKNVHLRQYLNIRELDPCNIVEVFSKLLQIEDVATLFEYESLIQRNVKLIHCSPCEYQVQFDTETFSKLKEKLRPNLDEIVLVPIDRCAMISRDQENLKKLLYFQNDLPADIKPLIRIVSEIKNPSISFKFDMPTSLTEKSIYIDLVFRPARFSIRYQRYALELLSKNLSMKHYLFPNYIGSYVQGNRLLRQTTDLKLINTTIHNNPEQLEAVINISTGANLHAPYIIFGPPGTGKTTTIIESILQIRIQKPQSRILVTAGSNSACDTIATRICQYYENNLSIYPIIRIYSKSVLSQGVKNFPKELLRRSNVKWNQGAHAYPAVEDIHKYGIVVATLCTVGKLVTGDIGYRVSQNHFTHVFIDEVAASTEPEALIGIMGIKHRYDDNCQVILSGDHKQLGAVLKSDEAAELGLGESLMERLLKRPCYALDSNGNYDRTLQIRLLRNYRSHPEIVELYNSLYYNNELLAMADRNANRKWSVLADLKFPIIFQEVKGTSSNMGGKSSCNVEEVDILMWYIKHLIKVDNVKQEDIGIISPYKLQHQLLKSSLKNAEWSNIEVGSVENFQGREKEVIVISMVRSFTSLGFLKDERRWNVMLSRAKSLLIVLGNSSTLCKFKDINAIIQKCKANQTYLRGTNFKTLK